MQESSAHSGKKVRARLGEGLQLVYAHWLLTQVLLPAEAVHTGLHR